MIHRSSKPGKRPIPRTWLIAAVASCVITAASAQEADMPTFANVTVHDPSVIRTDDNFYVFGSHLAAAKTADLMHWSQISSSPQPGNPLVPNAAEEMAEALEWADSNTFWAPDVIQLADGKFYLYYCVGRLDAPRAAMGLAVAEEVEGPYENLGVFLKSGMWGEASPDGRIYDPNIHPNAVDPHTFFDETGKLRMVYGSFSGGIFILQMDPATGFPLTGQGYGKKLIGGNHSRIEGAYILYSPETDYYYMFLSFGGLGTAEGYNIRVARSRLPDGPYLDPAGTDMTQVSGPPDSFFDDDAIAPHAAKLMGNYQFLHVEGEPRTASTGYKSPGHNSAYFDPETGKHYLIFHTRFVGRGEQHSVRVHQMFMNEDGWPVAAPHRYAGETIGAYTPRQLAGPYKLINHGKAISDAVNESAPITLALDSSVSGAASGTWSLSGDNRAELVLDGITYRGVFVRQWDMDNQTWVLAFSALSDDGVAVWGTKAALPDTSASLTPIPDQLLDYTETMRLAVSATGLGPLAYTLVEGPSGMAVDPTSGELTWSPILPQTGRSWPVTVAAADDNLPVQTSFAATVRTPENLALRRLDLDFSAAPTTGVRDISGQPTGFTTRLPGTGTALPRNDPNLTLDTDEGLLRILSTKSDLNNQIDMARNDSPGVLLSSLGFTGSEDFSVHARFRPLPDLGFIDQAGIFIGHDRQTLTRAGVIVFDRPEPYAVHTRNGADQNARFPGVARDGSVGLDLIITRQAGSWRYFIDGTEWNPTANGQKAEPAFLDSFPDLTVGVFAIHPLNETPKQLELDSFSAIVLTPAPAPVSLFEAWRAQHFDGFMASAMAKDDADPDGDTIPNLLEYALDRHPLTPNFQPALSVSVSGDPLRLHITFDRIADPALTYTVLAASALNGSGNPVWSSSGSINTKGPVTVIDTADLSTETERFIRLVVSL